MTAHRAVMARMRLPEPANDNGSGIDDPEVGFMVPALVMLCAWGAAVAEYLAVLGK